MEDAAPTTAPVLEASNLTKRFGDCVAVDGLSLAFRRGEIFGFLGPNGAGKTTTLRMLGGLLRPDSGAVRWGDGSSGAGRGTRRSVGISPQGIVIWETLTCLEQLEFMGRMHGLGRSDARRKGEELLSAFGLREKSHRLGRTLSGGMQRRLNIALGLVHDPEVLFLDEPQAGLDPQSRVMVRDYIRGLRGRMTVIVTTHDMEEAEKISDRVSIIDRGKLLAVGTVNEIKARLGDGDLLEIEIAEDPERDLVPHAATFRDGKLPFSVRDGVISFASPDFPAVLPDILETIRSRGLHLRQMRVRKRTLEDVFIHLTGRGLRE